jgi:succinylglutamic semialdehyde dehydrogenase
LPLFKSFQTESFTFGSQFILSIINPSCLKEYDMESHPGIFTSNSWTTGTGPTFHSLNPATGDIVWQGQSAATEQIDDVIKNAQKAFKEWSALPFDERSAYLNRFGELLKEKFNFLAEVISQETGKTLWDSKSEVSAMISKIGISLEAYGKRCAGLVRDQEGGVRLITRHRPHGVVAVFGPFNFPGHLPNGHIIPALLAGNTVVLKPSELTPLVSEEIMKCWEICQLPNGVINLVQGGVETGKSLARHPAINGLFFTGSAKVGLLLSEQFASQPQKILALEMGGNNPLIIGHIENLEAAAYLTIQSAYLSSGQRCTCARRLIVKDNENSNQFIEVLMNKIKGIIVGPYNSQPEPYIGPVISEQHAQSILNAQSELKAKGGIPLIEMRHLRHGTGLLTPGLMDVTSISNRPDEEIFGPFLQLIRVKSFEEAVEEANQTRYGLAAGLLSKCYKQYNYFYQNIRAGIVNWNHQLTGASSAAPFGGIGLSGNYRPSAYYAADYCSYPVASLEATGLDMPLKLPPGLSS